MEEYKLLAKNEKGQIQSVIVRIFNKENNDVIMEFEMPLDEGDDLNDEQD